MIFDRVSAQAGPLSSVYYLPLCVGWWWVGTRCVTQLGVFVLRLVGSVLQLGMGRLKPLEVLAVDWTEWGVGMGVVTNRLREVLEKGVTYPGDWTDLEIAQGIEWLEGVQKKREKERNQRYRVTYTGTLSVDNLRRSITLDSLQDYMGNAVRLPIYGPGLPTEKSGMKSVSFGLNGGQVDIVRVED